MDKVRPFDVLSRRSNIGSRVNREVHARFWSARGRFSRESRQVFIRIQIQGVHHYPWRAVDQDSVVLDILVQGVPAPVNQLRQEVGRPEITPHELEGRNACSAAFKTMLLAFRAEGAKDWKSTLTISLTNAEHWASTPSAQRVCSDPIVPEFDADLLLERVFDVDLGDDSEIRLLGHRGGPFHGPLEAKREHHTEVVTHDTALICYHVLRSRLFIKLGWPCSDQACLRSSGDIRMAGARSFQSCRSAVPHHSRSIGKSGKH